MYNQLVQYFQYPFVRYALIVGVMTAFCASLLGVTLVLRRFSFLGDALSHVAFGAMAAAAAMSLTNSMVVIFPVTALCAVLLLRRGENAKIQGDAAVAMLSVAALALGYLLMNRFSASPNLSGDVCTTLFGSTSILTLTADEVRLCALASLAVTAVFALFYHKIFAVVFDENFARAAGINTDFYNTVMAVVTALVIVLAMKLVGSLLISALIVFPALSAMEVFRSFRAVVFCSAVFAVLCTAAGILISILAGTPVGATIVALNVIGFCVFRATALLTARGAS